MRTFRGEFQAAARTFSGGVGEGIERTMLWTNFVRRDFCPCIRIGTPRASARRLRAIRPPGRSRIVIHTNNGAAWTKHNLTAAGDIEAFRP
jgi:hypothetical protein